MYLSGFPTDTVALHKTHRDMGLQSTGLLHKAPIHEGLYEALIDKEICKVPIEKGLHTHICTIHFFPTDKGMLHKATIEMGVCKIARGFTNLLCRRGFQSPRGFTKLLWRRDFPKPLGVSWSLGKKILNTLSSIKLPSLPVSILYSIFDFVACSFFLALSQLQILYCWS